MSKDFRERLSFNGQSGTSSHRENWRDALALLPDSVEEQKRNQQMSQRLLALPTTPENNQTTNLEWVIAEDSHSTRVILVPYFVDGMTSYRAPSLSHLLNHIKLGFFDHSWVTFFANYFCHDDVRVELNAEEGIQPILLTLAGAKRLRLASDDTSLRVEKLLQLKARLRFSEEWNMWALDAELVTDTGIYIAPEFLDFIISSGLIAYNGGLFSLSAGGAWVAQILMSGAWYIAKENLGEALYQLSRRIHDSEFLRHLSEVRCVRSIPLPVVYLKSKHFDKNIPASLYLAYRYGSCEVFSTWHGQGGEELPIGFSSDADFSQGSGFDSGADSSQGSGFDSGADSSQGSGFDSGADSSQSSGFDSGADSNQDFAFDLSTDSSLASHFVSDSAALCVLYFRDFSAESEMESTLKNEEGLTFVANKHAWTIEMSALWQVIHHLLALKWEVWAEKFKIEELSSFGMNAKSGIGWFELSPFDQQSGKKIDPLQLIKYLKRKALFIRLGHDRVCVLPERWIAHLSRFLGISDFEENKGWRFSSLYASEVEESLKDHMEFHADDVFYSTVKKMRSFDHVQPLEQPDGLRALLRPYQLVGLTWLNLMCELHIGGILADDMGLGKTVQVLALLQHRIVNQPDLTPQTILVVCPKSVQAHWFAQANNLVPRLNCHILNKHDIVKKCHVKQHVLLLASYGLVRHNIEAFSKWKYDLLIVDEAQMIKNDGSQTTQAIKKLCAVQRFALTGTPIENRFEELVSIFTFLNPHAKISLGSESPTAEALRSLVQRALHPFVLRRLKEDVLTDLPPKMVSEVALSMVPEQGRLHQELLEMYRREMTKYHNSSALPTEDEAAFFLEGLLRLRQIATYPQQLTGDSFQECASNKLEYLRKQIPELIENGHKIVVFSQFLGFLRHLAEGMNAVGIRHSYIDGETPGREREIHLFQSNSTIKVLLISLRVGGVGIDLTSSDVCIIADPWWNDAVERQAIDRLHRFGQKKPVKVLRLISAGSIEEKMEILKRNKSELADALGKTSPDFLNHLKWEDFTEIF